MKPSLRVQFGSILFASIALSLGSIPTSLAQTAGAKPLTIEAVFAEGSVTGRGPEDLKWSPDNSKLSFVQRDDAGEHGELWYMDAATGEKKVLVSESKLGTLAPPTSAIKDEREKERVTRYHVAAYVWAPDSKSLLFDSQGQLWLYGLDKGLGVQLTSAAEPSEDPKFSPDGSHLAYVRKHNLFVRDVAQNAERELTADKDGNILNGEVDWVYAEELAVRSNYFWSPDGKRIAFLQTNETRVPAYPITNWMPVHSTVDMEKYPQPGDPNPEVRLGVIEAKGGKPKWLTLTADADTYVPRFGWAGDGFLWAEVLNRNQDTMDLYFVDVRSGKSRKVLTENCPECWVKVNDDFKILKSGDRFLWSSWRSGNSHFYLYSFDKQNPLAADAKMEKQLTEGNFEVLALKAVDDAAGEVYFSCNKGDPRQEQIYSVKLDGSAMTQVSQGDGTHDSNFSDDGKHYTDSFSSTLKPPVVAFCASAGGACQKVWQARDLTEYGLLPPKELEFKADDGTTLYGELLLPAAGNSNARVPLIVNIYGGPAGQTVLNGWNPGTLFDQILAQKGFAVFTVDNRGTPGRDRKFQTVIRHQFGAIELKDQLTALDQLFEEVPQLDRARVGIFGWSYGGSMTLYAMTHSDAFKAGVSGAPVTDWHNYDSIYTERYMGLPKDNAKAYDDTLPKAASRLHGSLLLVHGTSDDNVHFQNSVQMADELIKAGKQFDFMIYPNMTHGISGVAANTHLFHLIENHFERELK